VDAFAGEPVPDCATADGLVIMGGAMCANDPLQFLRSEMDAIREAAARGQPVFGVCLGAQLIARALGATVHRGATRESGWLEVRLGEAARSDPIFSTLQPVETVFQLHEDTFDLPPGATVLAGSEVCPHQAFRYDRAIYGVQFHPEMTPAMMEEWRRELDLPPWETPPGAYAQLARTCERLIGGWSALL
jgi:GMP synthase-like glutamine amidotransferase